MRASRRAGRPTVLRSLPCNPLAPDSRDRSPVLLVDSRLVATLPSALSPAVAAAVPIGVLNSKGCCYLNVDLRKP